jgi:hypothetical protein
MSCHESEYNQIVDEYGKEKNFIVIYKELIESSLKPKFSFINMKDVEVISSDNVCDNSTVLENHNDSSSHVSKEEIDMYLLKAISTIKQYYDERMIQLQSNIMNSNININSNGNGGKLSFSGIMKEINEQYQGINPHLAQRVNSLNLDYLNQQQQGNFNQFNIANYMNGNFYGGNSMMNMNHHQAQMNELLTLSNYLNKNIN